MADTEQWTVMVDNGFIDLVGPVYAGPISDGIGRFRFRAAEKHKNRAGFVHGGMLMAFADRALGTTARHRDPGRAQATAQLDMHFIQPVRIEALVFATCRIIRETRSLVFVDGELTVDNETVATARGVWKIIATAAHDYP